MKTSEELRRDFISFFTKREHSVVRGSPLILPEDPTLLFVNAGMNQFKPIFLGLEQAPHPRVVNTQRCMRVSGKHNDLEEVGFSPHHHTLFEMLGNWSFGDYYKEDAIKWAWELLTGVWGLPREKLWVTVFQDEMEEIPKDDEAAEVWIKHTDVNPDHIRYFGRKDNFWEMGDTGPCGPCTEIHIDRGPDFCDKKHVPGHTCRVNGDCRRITELWNLVFIQYNRVDRETFRPLPHRHVDTGMGFERITSVIQKTRSNYDTDLFHPIISRILTLCGKKESDLKGNPAPFRVIADHVRAASFLITDGIFPSNEWRGYVLRRIIRRAVRFGTKIGFDAPFLHDITDVLVDKMAGVFPELLDARTRISRVIRLEEDRFFKTLRRGLPMVEELIGETKASGRAQLPGADIFKLYDTYGFPVDIIRDIAAENGLSIDENEYRAAMEEQKTRARNAWKTMAVSSVKTIYHRIEETHAPVRFSGYDRLKEDAAITAIILDGRESDACRKGDTAEIIIDPTPFYAESGGQVGDKGLVEKDGGVFQVDDTVICGSSLIVLKGKVTQGSFHKGDTVTARVNIERRKDTMRHHTATHLLHAALRHVLGDHVKQSGSLVAPERLRFDFTHFSALQEEELRLVEEIVNDAVIDNPAVEIQETDLETALEEGVMALFGERYGDRVRVVRIGDISAELCGGTHVRRTGEIGFFKILSESGISAGVRRIEAVAGKASLVFIQDRLRLIESLARRLKTPVPDLPKRIESLQIQLKTLQKKADMLAFTAARHTLEKSLENIRTIEGVPAVVCAFDGVPINQLRDLADFARSRMKTGVVVLGSNMNGKVGLVAVVSKDLTHRIHAGKLVKHVASFTGGSGGGRPDMAQAGGTDPSGLPVALENVFTYLKRESHVSS